MQTINSFWFIFIGGLMVGFITALVVRKNGYSFWRYFATGTIMGAGIIGLVMKIVRDYL